MRSGRVCPSQDQGPHRETMMNKLNGVAGLTALSLMLSTAGAFAQTEVTWWHAMGGELGEKLESIVAQYNES